MTDIQGDEIDARAEARRRGFDLTILHSALAFDYPAHAGNDKRQQQTL